MCLASGDADRLDPCPPAPFGTTTPSVTEHGGPYDAILIVSFGGPEAPDEVMPFLERVTRGRPVPRERLEVVAQHYHYFGGRSPINDEARALVTGVEADLAAHGDRLPVYLGNRNWHPLLEATLARMRDDGVRRAAGFVTSAFRSWSGCRQYLEAIEAGRAAVGEGAPVIDKLRPFWDHPGFIAPVADSVAAALSAMDPARRGRARVVFTAHSIPVAMARGCRYEVELAEACHLVAERAAVPRARWSTAWQSRSGPPSVPWLEPDILDHLRALADEGARD